MDYPKIPPVTDLIVDDQFEAATDLGVALVMLPCDHPVVIACRLAFEMRDAHRAEVETTRSISSSLARRSSSRRPDELTR